MRYALYAAPPAGSPLARWGARILGRDAATGESAASPEGLPFPSETWTQWTAEPRRYGFHATLKPPFELRDGVSEDVLTDSLRGFVAARQSFVIERLRVARLEAFVALVPIETPAALSALAEDCVRSFDRFRAPLSEADRARRVGVPLTPRQRAHLDDWGYPYVLQDFRFHMTLTGALPVPVREQVADAIAALYAPIDRSLTVDAVTLFGQPDRATPFRVLARFPFGQAA